MKKPTSERRTYRIRVTRKRTARRLRSTRRFGRRTRATALRRLHARYEWIAAPSEFEIEGSGRRKKVVDFLRELRTRAFADRPKPLAIDFRATVFMTAAGTLLFAAELDRIKTLGAPRRITCNDPRNNVVAQVLQHVDIFELLGHTRTYKITAPNVKYWKIHSGEMVDGEQADQAMAGYKHLFSDQKQMDLYGGLTEAMANCRQHAYTEDRGDGQPNVEKWWMFSQQRDERLVVAFCDLGIGIPRSLPKDRNFFRDVVRLIREGRLSDNDGTRIQAAMAVGASRTGKDYRGKGLMDIRSVLDGLNGWLQIHSNQGFYKYKAEDTTETCETFPKASIGGTLVVWRIPVPEATVP